MASFNRLTSGVLKEEVPTLLIGGCAARTQQQYPTAEIPTAEPAYIAKVKTAAPQHIVNKASIVMIQAGGKSRELQAGSNGYTCLIAPGMEWIKAVGAKTEPPDKLGFIYRLAGDTGATNTIRISRKRGCTGCRPVLMS